jgi:outer membrane lipopolysaccharide assembly protein LptE/RlpB
MAVKAAVPFLVAMMLLTGVCNTLLTKYQVCKPFYVATLKPNTDYARLGHAMRQELRLSLAQASRPLRATRPPDSPDVRG